MVLCRFEYSERQVWIEKDRWSRSQGPTLANPHDERAKVGVSAVALLTNLPEEPISD